MLRKVTFTKGQGHRVKMKGEKETLLFVLQTRIVTITKFGTIILCGKTLQSVCDMVKVKVQCEKNQLILIFYLVTFEATVMKLSTIIVIMVICGEALQIVLCTVTFT